jgi:hypothetical protein
LKAGGIRFKRTVTGSCDACGRSVKWTQPAQLPLTSTPHTTTNASTSQVLTTIQKSLIEADNQRHQINAGARPPRRDRYADAAEAAKEDKYFDALARGEDDKAERKLS